MKDDKMEGMSYRIETPDGTMFIHIVDSNDTKFPAAIRINIGKSGAPLAAWADAVARLATRLLPHVGVNGVIEEISGITADKISATADGPVTRSGPEGIAVALLRHRALWFKRNKPE